MPPEILALLDQPLWPLIALFGLVLAGMVMDQAIKKQKREAWKRRNAWRWKKRRADGGAAQAPGAGSVPAFDAAEQLRCVMAAQFEKQPLLNKSEARVLLAAERAVREVNQGWRVMAQVSRGEVLKSPDGAAYRAINTKRVDFLIIDRNGESIGLAA
ncbi:MAG TPA: DUF2726 domain-containing protein [Allosphingosinicella sp.]|jgi:hypothetical protein